MRENRRIIPVLKQLKEHNGLLYNKEIYSIINKYADDYDTESVERVIDEYNKLRKLHEEKRKQIIEYNQTNNYKDVFSSYGIYTINDLYQYMNDNFEYGGVITYEGKRFLLPFGPVFGVAHYNRFIKYQDDDVFHFVLDFYKKLNGDDKVIAYLKEEYKKQNSDICNLKEYQQAIYQVSAYIQQNLWHQRSVKEILEDQISNCYESTYLVGEFFKLKHIPYQKYIIGRYDNLSLAHEFITYNIEGKYYYFEHALRDFKGIYEYHSKEELEQDIFVKFIYNDNYKMSKEINFKNYFLKAIDDLSEEGNFLEYFQYFDTLKSVKLREKNYYVLMKLTDMVCKEMLEISALYKDGRHVFCHPILLPLQEDFYDIELWNKQAFKLMRKKIINLVFSLPTKKYSVYKLNPLGAFIQYDNMLVAEDKKRTQVLPNEKKASSIYTMKDLKDVLQQEDITKVKDILMLQSLLENKNDLYEYGCYFATMLSRETLKLIDTFDNKVQDIDSLCELKSVELSGKIIDKRLLLSNDNFLEQIFSIGTSLEVMIEAIQKIVGKSYQQDFINTYIDYLIYMINIDSLDIEKISNINKEYTNSFEEEFITKLLSKLLETAKSRKEEK